MTIEEVLEEIENLVLDAARVPFTNKRVLEEDDIARLLDDLRDVMPTELMEAKRILSERSHIMEEANKEAQNIVDQAKIYVAKLTDENVVTKQAQEQANEIVATAQQAARNLQNDAICYADDVFNHLEANVQKVLEVVQSGHKELRQNNQD
ncbi:MAG: ATPase [Veillonellales bacterium]